MPTSIRRPDWAETGIPVGEQHYGTKWTFLDRADRHGQEGMRRVAPGQIVPEISGRCGGRAPSRCHGGPPGRGLSQCLHRAQRTKRPIPKSKGSVLTAAGISVSAELQSLSEVPVHFSERSVLPHQRVLLDGDILNLDISLYHGGYHADVNETYYVGDRAKADPDSVRVVETARECLDEAIKLVKPGTPVREFGKVIERRAKSRGCAVIANWGGHGINTEFHPAPWIPHYAKNKAVGVCEAGLTFTIKPILALGQPQSDTGRMSGRMPRGRQADGAVCMRCTVRVELISADGVAKHTLLVTETGVEDLKAQNADSPGGPMSMAAALMS